jgi:KipI family sensor histidine kinase inhibitor
VVILPYGPRAVLVECRSGGAARIAEVVRRVEGVLHAVPAASTVLVEHDGRADIESALDVALADAASSLPPPTSPSTTGVGGEGGVVEIAVRYDGDDLAAVADLCGLGIAEVIALHTGCEFTSAFCGFAPGFAYLTGLPEPLASVPRRATPRTRVPAGAVALAGGYSAVYPSASPGGWHLIGRTDAVLWDADARPPARLPPGTAVRFTPVRS